MTKQEIITKLAKDKYVEGIITNVGADEDKEDLKDLSQDIYIELLMKDDATIEQLYANNQLNYYIIRIVLNNIRSKNSRYYYMYKKMKTKTIYDKINNIADYYEED